MSKLPKVTGDGSGNIIVPSSNNPDWGYIRLEQEREMFGNINLENPTGILKIQQLSAIVPGLITDLKRLGWKEGQTVPGKLVVREQLLPFNKSNPEKSLKIAGDTGVVCKQGSNPIYRNTFYTPDANAQDVLISHSNSDEIRAVMSGVTTPVEEESDFKLD